MCASGLRGLMAVACVAGAESVAPQVSVDSADIVAIVQRSLPFVKEKGLQWMEDRKCASCHQVPSMVWSLHSAVRAGLETDQTKVAEWTQWATDWTHWNKSGAQDGIDKRIVPDEIYPPALARALEPA